MDEKLLIQNTTREERERIVARAIHGENVSCDGCAGCDSVGLGSVFNLYRPYIDGEKELFELNASFPSGTQH